MSYSELEAKFGKERMPEGKEGKKASPIAVIAVVVVGFVVLAFIWSPRTPREEDILRGIPEENVSAVVSAALPQGVAESVAGTILQIQVGRGFALEVPMVLGLTIPKSADLRVRSIILTAETKFMERTLKDPVRFQAEVSAYRRNKRGEPPSPYSYREISSTDLKVGDALLVRGDGRDVKILTSFEAASVTRMGR